MRAKHSSADALNLIRTRKVLLDFSSSILFYILFYISISISISIVYSVQRCIDDDQHTSPLLVLWRKTRLLWLYAVLHTSCLTLVKSLLILDLGGPLIHRGQGVSSSCRL
jgi:hypothetical protein